MFSNFRSHQVEERDQQSNQKKDVDALEWAAVLEGCLLRSVLSQSMAGHLCGNDAGYEPARANLIVSQGTMKEPCSMPDTMADRRDATRYPLTLVAEVSELVDPTLLIARSSDVSRSGCYIDTLTPLPPGTDVKIQLRSGDEVFETPARIVYICPGLGMGVHWGTKPTEKQFSLLDRWLQKAARVPA